MYCSASQWMDSASSCSLIDGSWIFLTMTELPLMAVATSCVLMRYSENSRWIASMTDVESIIWPSTMASWGRYSSPIVVSCQVSPFPGFISTALTELDPMSSPTRFFFLPKRPMGPSSQSQLAITDTYPEIVKVLYERT